jgi:hypothetical protein
MVIEIQDTPAELLEISLLHGLAAKQSTTVPINHHIQFHMHCRHILIMTVILHAIVDLML